MSTLAALMRGVAAPKRSAAKAARPMPSLMLERSATSVQTFAERRRRALPITDTELPAIAAAASEGASRSPNTG